MERAGMYATTLTHSFSMPSLAEGSEPISEAEEFIEMKSLREKGDKAMKIRDFVEAIRCYNEALEIDEQNIDVLTARSTAYLEMDDYIHAQQDAETLINIDPENAVGHKLQGLALKCLKQNKEALTSFLTALDLDPDNSDELTNHIASVATKFCEVPADLADTLKEMDSYKKLSEVGVCLFQSKKYTLCIRILEAAQKFQTNQKGITMRILLSLANAHSALKHTEQAINLYQECLSTAMATHDQIYQTKSLVNIATLYLEVKDTNQAIVYYEKLLHLEAELLAEAGDEENLPDFWTKELQCGLHLNLSIAYKAIGNMQAAVRHARKYVAYVETYDLKGKLRAESYHNTGMLNEILGNFSEAVDCYNKYLRASKVAGEKKGMAQAYGCLGSVYAALQNWKLSITYHEQYIAMATKSQDQKMLSIANEMLADTYMLKEDFPRAVKHFESMLNACTRTDYRTKATAFCKLGSTYRAMKKNQYSLYFYEQACDLSEDFEFQDILMLSQYNIACILQTSTQMMDIEKAQKYFVNLIPFLESKIREHREQDTHCTDEYHHQLMECYDGLQTVLSKLGNKEECLQFAEAYRRRHITQMHNYPSSFGSTSLSHSALWDVWTVDRMNRVVAEQNATVLYYSLLRSSILLWVLSPGEGLVRFYAGKAASDNINLIEQVQELISELCSACDFKNLQNECESKALPLKISELELTRNKYRKLEKSEASKPSTPSCKSDSGGDNSTSGKSVQRRLYDLLFAPIEDILSKHGPDSHIVIIPDKDLCLCPFGLMQDWLFRNMSSRFHITYLPSLLMLEKAVANELNGLRNQDDLEFQRSQSRKGGLNRFLTEAIVSSAPVKEPDCEDSESPEILDLKKVSNPRLYTTGILKPGSGKQKPAPLSRENTMLSTGSRTPRQLPAGVSLPSIPEASPSISLRSVKHIGSPAPTEKMLSAHTFSTLSTKTSTGTDITTSSQVITQFQQISDKDKCMIFANPALPESLMLHGKCWRPGVEELVSARREAMAVGEYLDCDPIMGRDATKQKFLEEIPNATVVHIVTYGCWAEGLLVMAPNPVRVEDGPPQEISYLIYPDDIMATKLSAQLVVLNAGFSPHRKDYSLPGYKLPGAFLAAGAQCVLICLWPLPDIVMEKFYHHFYMTLQNGCFLTTAVMSAIQAVKRDDRFQDIFYWCPFILVGKDVRVDLKNIRHAMLDQLLDRTESRLEEETGKEILNPKLAVANVSSKEDNLKCLQKILGQLLHYHRIQLAVVPELLDLLDSALKRLHTEENNKQTTCLSEKISRGTGGIDLLKMLGFHFQAKGVSLSGPYVVYPHWNRDELLIPTYDALRAIQEISAHTFCTQALVDLMPTSQDFISLLVDILSITKHAPEIQLKVSDLSVRPLWQHTQMKKLLTSTGFHQIGMLLNFNRTPANRQLMTAVLQFLLSVSAHKSQVLLYRLDVNLLGKPSVSKTSSMLADYGKLPSLTPLILPRNQLRMSTPWLSCIERADEMEEKVRLAQTKSDLDEKFQDHLDRAKSWHQMTVVAQANEALAKYGRPRTSPTKVKVLPGASASADRVPVNKEPILFIPEVNQRRDYAHYVLQQRMQNIDHLHKNEVLKLYLPYIQTT